MPELVSAMSSRSHPLPLLIVCSLATQLPAGCLTPAGEGHAEALMIERIPQPSGTSPDGRPRLVVDMGELEARIPFLAAAVDAAAAHGFATVDEADEVDKAWAFFDEKFGREVRQPFILDVGPNRFLVGGIAS